ncbi:sensor histidine kinase [Thalassobaculum salexigens]|uniref:sensor histidine kinase n=1 Tax=Thalassobaculum salexigens TaxID=455360 RepID=UPI00248D51DF|nr:HAMP domain-containing sensor histidine kinase [Thalassobaculum salexigens]
MNPPGASRLGASRVGASRLGGSVSFGAFALVLLLSLCGVAASVLGALRLAESSRQNWLERGRMEALELSSAVDGALLQVEAQLGALVTLFHSSSFVEADELSRAEANLPSDGLSVTLSGLAFAAILDDSERRRYEDRRGIVLSVPGNPDKPSPSWASHFPVMLASQGHPQFHEGADLAAIAPLRSMALSATRLERTVVMSPTFQMVGRRFAALAVSAPNGGTPGLLLGILDVDELFERMVRWELPGLSMRLLEYPGSWELDSEPKTVRGVAEPPSEAIATFDHRFTHGEARWHLQWSLLPSFEGGVDTVPAFMLGIGGSMLSLLVGLALCLLIYQNALIRQRVDERTAELSDALNRAEAGNQAKTNFLAVIGHELRTPLNAVIGFADLLESRQPTDEARSYVNFVRGGGRHLLRLVNALLEVAQAETGELALEESEIDVTQMIVEAVRSVDASVMAPGVAIALDLAEGLPTVRGDRERLQLVVVNLVLNAIRAAGEGGRVAVGAWRGPEDGDIPNGGVRIRVCDTGSGMTENQVQASLQLFEQVESPMNRRHEGLGIGLPLCRHLVRLHGGTLEIDTRPGQGTAVTVDLPPHRILSR